jgi:hypothetical protein
MILWRDLPSSWRILLAIGLPSLACIGIGSLAPAQQGPQEASARLGQTASRIRSTSASAGSLPSTISEPSSLKLQTSDLEAPAQNSTSVRAEARVDRNDTNLVRSSELMEGLDSEAAKPPENATTSSTSKAVAKFEGTAAPGLRIWLNAEGSRGDDLHFLWLQTRGPEVHLEKTDVARVPILVPGNAIELAFRLIVSGKSGMDQTSLDIPLELHARPSLPPLVVADAGDDQTGVVGHRITLNGIRSRPRERAAYRWIQVAGPAVSEPVEEAWIYSFVPTEPGLYRFVLVVAAEGVISPPDMVSVAVTAGPPAALADQPERQQQNPIAGQAHSRIRQIDDGLQYAHELATAFEDVAKRASVYSSYEELFSEISRRIDSALPREQTDREEWDRVVFIPLTKQIVQSLKQVGLDLNRDSAQTKPLSEVQKERLSALFLGIARGFRSEDQTGAPAGAAASP